VVRAGDLLAAAAVGLAVFLAITYSFRARRVTRLRKRLAPHVPAPQTDAKNQRATLLEPLLRVTERALGGSRLKRRLASVLERADSSMRPSGLVWLMIGSGALPALPLLTFGAPMLVVVLLFTGGALAPYLILSVKGAQRRRAFDDQLPDLLMTMAASVRVGHTFRQAMQTVVEEGQEPASKEFGRALLETDLGRPVDRVLHEMAQRLGSRNFDYVMNAVTIQREVGGSLATLLDVVSNTVRQRQQFTKKVSALTAQGRLSAYVLVVLPFVAVGILSALDPHYMAPLFSTSAGRILICVAIGGMVIGSFVLKKVVSFRME
jgi:tight adherence protein B